MGHREAKILWLKDMLDQLRKSQQQLQWTDNPDTIRVLTESMVRDLESCRRICEEMNRKAYVRQTV
jgi:hypothetical protein